MKTSQKSDSAGKNGSRNGHGTPQVALCAIGSLKPYPNNARTHSEAQIGQIAASIKEFGFTNPLLVDKKGTVLAGHGRLAAAQSLGMAEVPVIRLEGMTAVQRRAYVLADNKLAENAGWDEGMLASELDALRVEDFDLGLLGFDEKEIEALIPKPVVEDDPGPLIDRAAELQRKWKTQRGQVWEIGKHRLMCGDSQTELHGLIDGAKIVMLVTSPPYNQGIDKFSPSGMHKEADWVPKVKRLAYQDSLPEADYQLLQGALLCIWHDVLPDGASVFYNHKNRYREKELISPMRWIPGPFKLRQEIVWSRPGSVTQNARMFLPSDERIYWLYKGDDFTFDDSTEIKSFSTVWDISPTTNKDHAVAFPVEIPSRCIRAASNAGDVALDPFLGSGTTMVAAEQLGRVCYGMEIEPKYVAVCLERLSALGLTTRLAK